MTRSAERMHNFLFVEAKFIASGAQKNTLERFKAFSSARRTSEREGAFVIIYISANCVGRSSPAEGISRSLSRRRNFENKVDTSGADRKQEAN